MKSWVRHCRPNLCHMFSIDRIWSKQRAISHRVNKVPLLSVSLPNAFSILSPLVSAENTWT